MSEVADRIARLERTQALIIEDLGAAIATLRRSGEFRTAVEALLAGTSYKRPAFEDLDGLYERLRIALKGANVSELESELREANAEIKRHAMDLAYFHECAQADRRKIEELEAQLKAVTTQGAGSGKLESLLVRAARAMRPLIMEGCSCPKCILAREIVTAARATGAEV